MDTNLNQPSFSDILAMQNRLEQIEGFSDFTNPNSDFASQTPFAKEYQYLVKLHSDLTYIAAHYDAVPASDRATVFEAARQAETACRLRFGIVAKESQESQESQAANSSNTSSANNVSSSNSSQSTPLSFTPTATPTVNSAASQPASPTELSNTPEADSTPETDEALAIEIPATGAVSDAETSHQPFALALPVFLTILACALIGSMIILNRSGRQTRSSYRSDRKR